MLFQIDNNTLRPANVTAERYVQARSGQVDLMPVSTTKRRSLDQNRLYWAWCHEVEQAQGWKPGDAHRYHKWHYGLAILTHKHPEYRDRLMAMLRALEYEQRLNAMDLISCTSMFTVSEMQTYLDTIQQHWAEQGILLET